MPTLAEHPSVIRFKEHASANKDFHEEVALDREWLYALCLSSGVDDIGFVEIDRKGMESEKDEILTLLPGTKSIVALACKINRDNIRTPSRSVANTEFLQSGEQIISAAKRIVSSLNDKGVRAVSISGLFPLEMDRWPGKIWDVSLKPLAVAAGLGHMGHHRMVIHPRFGSFIYLSAILIDREVTSYDQPLDYNPCLKCKLCSATCPTGAIASDGHFDFASCVTHNYREKLGGFSDWTENIVSSGNKKDYRKRVSDSETASMWQSLATGGNTKCDQCMAVCPAGDEVIAPFITDRKAYIKDIVKPLQNKEESIYVVPASDAESYVKRRFPLKKARAVGNGLRAGSISGFIMVLPRIFQRRQSKGIKAIYHFTFTGNEKVLATVTIKDETIKVIEGHIGKANLHVHADSKTWLKFLAKESNIVWAIIRRKIRVKGPLKLLIAFGRCFPS
ncbi:MAG: SCP2 sterol-binding domain-containing protein [Candidatus Polarisedimenticolaceae bacterium]|nr:SCP2 sterol-binding domain-containing protein [Candidatus Polarisedimenticolaceae bacterium]